MVKKLTCIQGNHIRDFIYIEDVVSIVQKLIKKIPSKSSLSIYNIGKINDYIKEIQKQFKKKIKVNNAWDVLVSLL